MWELPLMLILIELIQLGRIEVKKTPNAVEGQLTERKAGRPPAYYCKGGTQKTRVPP